MPKPTDAIRRKIVIYVEGSPEEVAKFQQGMETVFFDYPDSLLLPREGSPAWGWMWPLVKANVEAIANPWVVVSQAFIDPVPAGAYFPELDWRGINQPTDDVDC